MAFWMLKPQYTPTAILKPGHTTWLKRPVFVGAMADQWVVASNSRSPKYLDLLGQLVDTHGQVLKSDKTLYPKRVAKLSQDELAVSFPDLVVPVRHKKTGHVLYKIQHFNAHLPSLIFDPQGRLKGNYLTPAYPQSWTA